CSFVPYSGIFAMLVSRKFSASTKLPQLLEKCSVAGLTRNRDGVDFATSGPARKRSGNASRTRFQHRTVTNRSRDTAAAHHKRARHAAAQRESFSRWRELASVRN